MFEHSLLEAQTRVRSRFRVFFVPIAIAVHGFILAGVVVAQYWNVDPVPEPPIQVSFFSAVAPPPPPPPPAAPPPAAAKPKPQEAQAPTEPVQPVEIPEEIPEAPDQPESVGVEGGVPGGVPGGIPGGVPGGMPGGVPGGVPGVTEVPDEVLQLGGAIVKPEVIRRVQPNYTEIARKARVQGIVIVEAIVDKQGDVTNVRVLKGLPMGLEQSAMDAVRQWKFKPATLNGRPVSVYFVLTINFRLN